jgi:hypothetical protein
MLFLYTDLYGRRVFAKSLPTVSDERVFRTS